MPPPGNHERMCPDLHSGTLHCTLETLSMLCIRPHFQALSARPLDVYLPASSLKGMARSMAQTLGAGCASLFEDRTEDPKHRRAMKEWRDGGKRGPEPRARRRVVPDLPGFEPCTQSEACLTCRVFGYAPERDAEQDDRQSGWAGKIRFHDSRPARGWDRHWVQPPQGTARWQSQGTYHTPFYYPDPSNDRKPAGWKVYLHAKQVTGAATGFRPDACVPERVFFDFDVDYENLNDEEFAVIRFALTLRHECLERPVHLAHKLGYGKAIGMGSCRVSAQVAGAPIRRFFGEAPGPDSHRGCEIHDYLDLPGFARLQEFLNWENRPDMLRFPDHSWFAGAGSIDDYEASMNAPAAPPPSPAPAPPPSKAKFPKRVDVRITKVTRKGDVHFEAVADVDGIRYTGIADNSLLGARVGTVCELKPRAPDPQKKTVSGRLSWKLK